MIEHLFDTTGTNPSQNGVCVCGKVSYILASQGKKGRNTLQKILVMVKLYCLI